VVIINAGMNARNPLMSQRLHGCQIATRGRDELGKDVALGSADNWMLDAAREQEREAIRIDSPHQCPDAKRASIWRDEL